MACIMACIIAHMTRVFFMVRENKRLYAVFFFFMVFCLEPFFQT